MKKLYLVACLTAALVLFPSLALADNVQNDVIAGGNDTFTAGASTTVNYRIAANSGDGQAGCNAADASAAVVTIVVPAAVTATPPSRTFTSCGTDQPVVFTSTTPGDYEITASVSDSGAGTYNLNPAKFTLHVLAPTDTTAPTTTITLNPAFPDGNNGWYVSPVLVTVSSDDATAETRCVLDPAITPTAFSHLPAAACPYLGAGANVGADGNHRVYAAGMDTSGNVESPLVVATFKIDQTDPTVTCGATPTFILNQSPASVSATVSDATSGPLNASVSAAVSTAAVGSFSQNLTGEDQAGNTTTVACSYQVAYGICVLADYSKPRKLGSTVPLKLQLCDADGNNVSAAGVVVKAVGFTLNDATPPADQPENVEDSGNANPDSNFRYSDDLDGYIFNLSTKNLGEGEWWTWFTAGSDPTLHAIAFSLKK